jgi:hypothetical protein
MSNLSTPREGSATDEERSSGSGKRSGVGGAGGTGMNSRRGSSSSVVLDPHLKHLLKRLMDKVRGAQTDTISHHATPHHAIPHLTTLNV